MSTGRLTLHRPTLPYSLSHRHTFQQGTLHGSPCDSGLLWGGNCCCGPQSGLQEPKAPSPGGHRRCRCCSRQELWVSPLSSNTPTLTTVVSRFSSSTRLSRVSQSRYGVFLNAAARGLNWVHCHCPSPAAEEIHGEACMTLLGLSEVAMAGPVQSWQLDHSS